jgi:hypothetical protein
MPGKSRAHKEQMKKRRAKKGMGKMKKKGNPTY